MSRLLAGICPSCAGTRTIHLRVPRQRHGPCRMSIRTVLEFLGGSPRAILEVAGRRGWLAVGFLFVLAAAFARECDGADLLSEPWHLLLPLVASLALSFVLFLPVYWRLAPRAGPEGTRERPAFRDTYLSFLAVFWMTAPLGLLYAIPYDGSSPKPARPPPTSGPWRSWPSGGCSSLAGPSVC